MSIDLKKFHKELPAFTRELLKILLPLGLKPTLVGGVIRDFLLNGKIGHDWDIELTHSTLAWNIDHWKDLGSQLSRMGRVTYLPYDVIRLDTNSHQLEFSPPRIESFTTDQHHKNFMVSFDYRLSFAEAVKRRDFTINAMGIRFNDEKHLEFLDPLNGLVHLREKILHPCGSDFPRDPVRFLRAIRFLTKLDFTPSQELASFLKSMNASGYTPSYLWSEMQKSGRPLKFYGEALQLMPDHPELKLPVLMDLQTLSELGKVLIHPEKHESWMVGLEWVGVPAEDWQSYFSLSQESGRRLSRWAKSCKAFKKISPETFHGEFEEVRSKPEFDLLFDWYFTTKQLLQKHPDLSLLKMIEEYLPEWIHLYRFEPVKDVKHIDPPLRAKYQVWNLCQRL